MKPKARTVPICHKTFDYQFDYFESFDQSTRLMLARRFCGHLFDDVTMEEDSTEYGEDRRDCQGLSLWLFGTDSQFEYYRLKPLSGRDFRSN